MKKGVIKIEKGHSRREKTTPAEIAVLSESDLERNIAGVVNNWISERRENQLLEKIFSDDNISAWKVKSSVLNLEQDPLFVS